MTTYFPGVTTPGPSFDTMATGSIGTGVLTGGAISRSSAHNCVLVTIGIEAHPAVQLPTGCSVGDVFEVYVDTVGCYLLSPSGETIAASVGIQTLFTLGVFVRKLTDTFWGVVS